MQFKQKVITLVLVLLCGNAVAAEKTKASTRAGIDLGIAYDLGLGLSAQYQAYSFFLSGDALAVDYRIQNFYNDNKTLHFYVDVGGFVENHGANRDDSAGVRAPIGMTFGIERNLEVFIQAVPNYDFSNNDGFGVDGAAGIRYRF